MQSRTGKMKAERDASLRAISVIPIILVCAFALVPGTSRVATAQEFRGSFGAGEGGGFGAGERGFGPRREFEGRGGPDGTYSGPDGSGQSRGLGGPRRPSWRRPVVGCDFANCGWGRGGRLHPPILYRGHPIFFPPGVGAPPPYEAPPEDDPGTLPRVPHHPVRTTRPAGAPPTPPVHTVQTRHGHSAPVSLTQKDTNAHFVLPPSSETRYVPDEVLVEIPQRLSPATLRSLQQRLALTLIASRNFALLGTRVDRYRIAPHHSVAQTLRSLRAEGRVGGAQPNYVFALQQDASRSEKAATRASPLPPPAAFDEGPGKDQAQGVQPSKEDAPAIEPAPKGAVAPRPIQGAGEAAKEPGPAQAGLSPAAPVVPSAATDAGSSTEPLQYAVTALHLGEAHRLATGKGVRIAIIDSGIDNESAELKDRIVARLDTIGGRFEPHPHGTAIAGAILAHAKLVGVAPDAQVIAVRAFTGEGKSNGAEGTTFHILEGLDFVAAENARIVNMSFAGPRDAMLARALAALRAKGVAEVAAAGNAGAQSAPLYPGAEPGVIAVTATDSKNGLFELANHGAYIALAAPGVDILVPAPGDGVQIVSGTSIAAAHVSGIAALALERYGSLTPDALVGTLDAGARKPAPDAKPDEYGAGIVDAYGVVQGKPGADIAPSAQSARTLSR